MEVADLMTFATRADAESALAALALPLVDRAESPRAVIRVPEDLPKLDAVILDPAASESAKVLAGTLLALAPKGAVEGRFGFSIRVADAQGAT